MPDAEIGVVVIDVSITEVKELAQVIVTLSAEPK